MYALAIDLGTTTLAVSLVDCSSGVRCAISGALNPQRRFGADVISRLDAAVNSVTLRQEMTALIRAELRRIGEELCDTAGIAWDDVRSVAIAGNPAMQHILMGLDLKSLAFPPYRPLYTAGTKLKAADLEWAGTADVYIFPMPGGFVGGDTVAFIYGAEPDEAVLCLDMGTNGEIALIAGETVWATSAAAGPAFEGGNLSCGMAALPGAISSVRIEGERLRLQVIGNGKPCGICGSAVIEVITELLRCNILEAGGRLRDAVEIESNLAARVIEYHGSNAFVLYRDAECLIVLTQNDIRQLQLAKGAIRAGIDVLAERSCIHCHALKHLILTGSFGAVIRAEWLKTIGIFDESMIQTTRFTPEGALAGVEKALMSGEGFGAVEELAHRFRVVPLSGTPLFETLFMKHIDFPPYKI
ncbi:MAG: ATP-binding protein [Geobacteraceae bacterium]|nr:ATP-binding protein [Geobacteraceae bacterium]NTW80717.1 ATP-binding protein [Geobacteraceae bacterium]